MNTSGVSGLLVFLGTLGLAFACVAVVLYLLARLLALGIAGLDAQRDRELFSRFGGGQLVGAWVNISTVAVFSGAGVLLWLWGSASDGVWQLVAYAVPFFAVQFWLHRKIDEVRETNPNFMDVIDAGCLIIVPVLLFIGYLSGNSETGIAAAAGTFAVPGSKYAMAWVFANP